MRAADVDGEAAQFAQQRSGKGHQRLLQPLVALPGAHQVRHSREQRLEDVRGVSVRGQEPRVRGQPDQHRERLREQRLCGQPLDRSVGGAVAGGGGEALP